MHKKADPSTITLVVVSVIETAWAAAAIAIAVTLLPRLFNLR